MGSKMADMAYFAGHKMDMVFVKQFWLQMLQCVCVCTYVRVCVRMCALKRRVNHTPLVLTSCMCTMNVFQISPGVETLGLPAPSTQSLPHSTGQPLTKDGVFHQPAVGRVVTFAVCQLKR